MGQSNYDAAGVVVKRMLPLSGPSATGLSVPGTAAADTVLLRMPITDFVNFAGTARVRNVTGGTAAGPIVLICKSLGGTATAGTANAFGTYLVGTAADATRGTIVLTSTDFVPGDELVIVNKAGTAAATPVLNAVLSYTESLL